MEILAFKYRIPPHLTGSTDYERNNLLFQMTTVLVSHTVKQSKGSYVNHPNSASKRVLKANYSKTKVMVFTNIPLIGMARHSTI